MADLTASSEMMCPMALLDSDSCVESLANVMVKLKLSVSLVFDIVSTHD